jgi:hypothetical protein
MNASFAGEGLVSGVVSWTRLAAARDAAVQMIDTSIVRAHPRGRLHQPHSGNRYRAPKESE